MVFTVSDFNDSWLRVSSNITSAAGSFSVIDAQTLKGYQEDDAAYKNNFFVGIKLAVFDILTFQINKENDKLSDERKLEKKLLEEKQTVASSANSEETGEIDHAIKEIKEDIIFSQSKIDILTELRAAVGEAQDLASLDEAVQKLETNNSKMETLNFNRNFFCWWFLSGVKKTGCILRVKDCRSIIDAAKDMLQHFEGVGNAIQDRINPSKLETILWFRNPLTLVCRISKQKTAAEIETINRSLYSMVKTYKYFRDVLDKLIASTSYRASQKSPSDDQQVIPMSPAK